MEAITIFASIFGGGALVTLITFFINRHDKRKDDMKGIKDELEAIKKKIKNLDDKGDRREAVNCRVRILRFEDELQESRRHSKDSFDQVMTDITTYDHYCDQHPDFKNSQTAATVEHIRKVYAERLEKHDFT